MLTSTITQKGQVTIPKKLRDELQLNSNDRVVFVRKGDFIILKPVQNILGLRGSIKVKGSQDFSKIRNQVRKQKSEQIANE